MYVYSVQYYYYYNFCLYRIFQDTETENLAKE